MKPQDLLARLEAGYAYDPMYGELCNERDRLSDENAKLRELIKDLQVAPCCGEHCWMKLSDRMRELGIEVN